jgi:hypothetical protein
MRTSSKLAVLVTATLTTSSGCFDRLTAAEFREAVDDIVAEGQVQSMENGVIEITTSFTIGQAVEEIAQEIRDFLESQAACSNTTVEVEDGARISIDFGELGDACVYNGHTYAGEVEIVVHREDDGVHVDHTYFGLTNGVITLDGTKDVVWSEADGVVERDIESDITWEKDGREVDAQSSRTMTFLDWGEGPTQRIQIDGTRDWQSPDGDSHLDIDEVEFRLVDPVPQAGSYTLTIPSGKDLGLSFRRIDEDTIEVTAEGPRRSRVFHVTSRGGVEDRGDA